MRQNNARSPRTAWIFSAGKSFSMPLAQAVPVESNAEITINAPMERVWNLIADVGSWPKWNPAVTKVQAASKAAPGGTFIWKSKGLTITSTFEQVEPFKRLTWKGATFGTKAFHVWEFKLTEAGVLVRTHETFDGWLVRLLKGTMQKTLDETLPDWLKTLKTAAEMINRNVDGT